MLENLIEIIVQVVYDNSFFVALLLFFPGLIGVGLYYIRLIKIIYNNKHSFLLSTSYSDRCYLKIKYFSSYGRFFVRSVFMTAFS